MENDQNLDTIEARVEEKLKDKNRYEKLSESVIKEKLEKEAIAKARDEALKSANDLAKERDFYKDFSVNVTKYPGASEYQDRILEKVRSGYSTEDAMVSVLAKEGKLNTASSQPVQQPYVQVEGGSAPNLSGGNKSLLDMTPAEKLAALSDADKSGDLVNALRGK